MNVSAPTAHSMTDLQTPYFTVIIATYNAAATVCKSIESVLAQTEPAQVLVMDGVSSDETAALARRYEPRGVQVHVEKDRGVYDAWNKGLNHARGEWIIFLGADDYYDDPNSLRALRQALAAAPADACLAYGRVEVVNAQDQVIAVENKPWAECRDTLRRNMPYTHVGSAHHASLFLDKRFDPEFRIAGDYNFLYPILKRVSPIFVAYYCVRMGGGGLSTNKKTRRKLLLELKVIRTAYGISPGFANAVWTEVKSIYYGALIR